jgi:hypothetical protein
VPKGEKILFTKIDSKGGENLKWRINKRRGSTKIFEHTSRGSKLLNMNVAFPYALHMYDA